MPRFAFLAVHHLVATLAAYGKAAYPLHVGGVALSLSAEHLRRLTLADIVEVKHLRSAPFLKYEGVPIAALGLSTNARTRHT